MLKVIAEDLLLWAVIAVTLMVLGVDTVASIIIAGIGLLLMDRYIK